MKKIFTYVAMSATRTDASGKEFVEFTKTDGTNELMYTKVPMPGGAIVDNANYINAVKEVKEYEKHSRKSSSTKYVAMSAPLPDASGKEFVEFTKADGTKEKMYTQLTKPDNTIIDNPNYINAKAEVIARERFKRKLAPWLFTYVAMSAPRIDASGNEIVEFTKLDGATELMYTKFTAPDNTIIDNPNYINAKAEVEKYDKSKNHPKLRLVGTVGAMLLVTGSLIALGYFWSNSQTTYTTTTTNKNTKDANTTEDSNNIITRINEMFERGSMPTELVDYNKAVKDCNNIYTACQSLPGYKGISYEAIATKYYFTNIAYLTEDCKRDLIEERLVKGLDDEGTITDMMSDVDQLDTAHDIMCNKRYAEGEDVEVLDISMFAHNERDKATVLLAQYEVEAVCDSEKETVRTIIHNFTGFVSNNRDETTYPVLFSKNNNGGKYLSYNSMQAIRALARRHDITLNCNGTNITKYFNDSQTDLYFDELIAQVTRNTPEKFGRSR